MVTAPDWQLHALREELDEFTNGPNPVSYIGATWFQMSFDAIHSRVCRSGVFGGPNHRECDNWRPASAFGLDEWSEGSIAELVMEFIDKRLVRSAQCHVLITQSSYSTAFGICVRQAKQFLSKKQQFDTEAGRILTRIINRYEQQGFFYPQSRTSESFASLDGSEPDQGIDIKPVLRGLISKWVPRPASVEGLAEGSPFSRPVVAKGSDEILAVCGSYRVWDAFSVLQEVLANLSCASLYTNVDFTNLEIAGESAWVAVHDGMGEMMAEGPESLYSGVLEFAGEVFSVLSSQERHILQVRKFPKPWDKYEEITGQKITRQTYENKKRAIAGRILEQFKGYLSGSLFETSETLFQKLFENLLAELDEKIGYPDEKK